MAARVAEQFQERVDLRVERVTGGLGEFRVTLDGEDLFSSSRLAFPRTERVVQAIHGRLPG